MNETIKFKQTTKFEQSDLVEIKRINKYGKASRSVIAKKNIEKSKKIEACPVIRIPFREIYADDHPNPTVSHFCYGWTEGYTSLVLGYGSIYNHSKQPNAKYYRTNDDCMIFESIKDIKEGEEITVDYYPDEPNRSPIHLKIEQ
jgi:SET domain-containing protein